MNGPSLSVIEILQVYGHRVPGWLLVQTRRYPGGLGVYGVTRYCHA